jgi:hypothetical protein
MKLKPCVWCGGEAKMIRDSIDNEKKFNIECHGCGWELNGFDSRTEARNEWNGLINTGDEREFGKTPIKTANGRSLRGGK